MTRAGIKNIVPVAVSAIIAFYAYAEEVSADSAGVAARRWLEDDVALGCSLGSEIDSVRTCSPQADASFHVVKLKGGGFVVMSSDTTREPVVAFSSGGDLVESDANPMWVLLKKDLSLRIEAEAATNRKSGLLKATAGSSSGSNNEAKWSRLLGKSGGLLRASQGVFSVSDVRVAPLVQSKWNQGNVEGSPCYNYYTPNHYVCGCVATAGAQIMRYFQWPRSDVNVAQFTNPYCKVAGVAQTMTTKGGCYDWGSMPLVPDSSITDDERQAIGKLTSDIGICVGMAYASGGSSAGGYMLSEAFTNHYGYANALSFEWDGDISGSDDMKNALLSNFDAGLPVAIGLSGDGRHEIVGDGYGYSGDTLYLHFNMGWSGTDNAWYAPPQMAGSQFNFNVLDGFVCNIFTNSAYANGVICSGRVLDANANGIYALVLSAGSYVLSASSGDSSATKDITLSANVGIELIASGEYYGQYWECDTVIGNRCGQDITITGVAGVAEPQFNPASCLFYPSTNVTITCATEGATIRYTTDGTEPTESSPVYSDPIFIDDDTMVKARAWKDGMNPSAVVAEFYTYDASQGAPKGDYFDNPIKISGASGSRVIEDNSAYTEEPDEPQHTDLWYDEESGQYYYNYELKTVWYSWTAPSSGTMTLATKCSGGGYIYPTYIAVYTGDALSAIERLVFSTTRDDKWVTSLSFEAAQGVTYRIVGMMGYDGSGKFTLSWSGDLTVAATETSTTDVPVPYAWLDEYFPGSATGYYEVIVESNADTNRLATFGYQSVVKGKEALDSTVDWADMDSLHRFFKVSVEKK